MARSPATAQEPGGYATPISLQHWTASCFLSPWFI
jgi:hypothetical protein